MYEVGFLTACGNREDLLDMITMISPWDTPLFSMMPKGRSNSALHAWLTDALDATATAGAIEGGDFAGSDLVPRKRLTNITQIFRKDMVVSDTQRAENPAGVRDEYEYQVMKAMREIARNVEATLFKISNTSATGATATNFRAMKGIRGFEGDGLSLFDASGIITTARVVSAHQTMWTNGADPDTLFLSAADKKTLVDAILASNAGNTRNVAAADNVYIANIDVFESPFGRLAMVADRFIPTSTATSASAGWFLGERSKARLAFLRPIQHVPLAKTGDATKGMVRGELTLELLHPSSWGVGTGAT
jgi:hypothetical protein